MNNLKKNIYKAHTRYNRCYYSYLCPVTFLYYGFGWNTIFECRRYGNVNWFFHWKIKCSNFIVFSFLSKSLIKVRMGLDGKLLWCWIKRLSRGTSPTSPLEVISADSLFYIYLTCRCNLPVSSKSVVWPKTNLLPMIFWNPEYFLQGSCWVNLLTCYLVSCSCSHINRLSSSFLSVLF